MKERSNVWPLLLLAGVYILCSLRYFPGNVLKTAVETVLQIVTIAPIPGGATLVLVSFLQRSAGDKMPWDRMVRIYLTLGIMVEILFGVHDYLGNG
ncbi:MAG: hypothetical protein PHI06_01150 [Desulfobulbaceae bacterium]|nr:hypothetical protein [Desulfobulbaceae bacterium]